MSASSHGVKLCTRNAKVESQVVADNKDILIAQGQ
jgi:hypothetical protein